MRNADMPAMPVNEIHQAGTELGGLTKREYIAALCMQGLLAHGREDWPNGGEGETLEDLADEAVVAAEELLKALELQDDV